MRSAIVIIHGVIHSIEVVDSGKIVAVCDVVIHAHLAHIEVPFPFDLGFGFLVTLKFRAVEMYVAVAVVALMFLYEISIVVGTKNT